MCTHESDSYGTLICYFYQTKEAGTLLKAVNYNEEAFIIEEVKLFEESGPIKILKTFEDKVS